jgi:hypothetical protein
VTSRKHRHRPSSARQPAAFQVELYVDPADARQPGKVNPGREHQSGDQSGQRPPGKSCEQDDHHDGPHACQRRRKAHRQGIDLCSAHPGDCGDHPVDQRRLLHLGQAVLQARQSASVRSEDMACIHRRPCLVARPQVALTQAKEEQSHGDGEQE